MSVEIKTSGSALERGVPKVLFEARFTEEGIGIGSGVLGRYDVSADGKRFLINTPVEEATTASPITVVHPWIPAR